ncbi:MAG: integration host factor subunit alpha [Rhodobacteraceae bacterium]|nr:integration host factor subunit alpha [Paracoccaceae bacterium]
MGRKTLTRTGLGAAVFREVGLSQTESESFVNRVLELIAESLEAGEQVKITSFGTFSVRTKTARIGRNPKTRQEAPILPRRVLTFRPSHEMKVRVAAGNRGH